MVFERKHVSLVMIRVWNTLNIKHEMCSKILIILKMYKGIISLFKSENMFLVS